MTVTHLVNAVVDTVNKEGISVCVLCPWFAVTVSGVLCVCLPIVLLLKQFILWGGLVAFILGHLFHSVSAL